MKHYIYTRDEIDKEVSITKSRDQKAILTAHLLAQLFVKKDSKDQAKEKFIEALIFTMHFICHIYSKDEDERNTLRHLAAKDVYNSMIKMGLDVVDIDPLGFFIDRCFSINEEIEKMAQDSSYLTPVLLYNMYTNPLNHENINMVDAMEKIDTFQLLTNSFWFKSIYSKFLEILPQATLIFGHNQNS